MEEHRSIDINQWRLTGSGAHSDTYLCEDESLLLKLFKKNATEETATDDYTMAKKVVSLGVATADVFEIVKVGDKFGVIYQNIKNKKSYSRMIADEPERIREFASAFAARTKELHSTPCDTELFEGRTYLIRKGIENSKFIGRYKADLNKLVDEIDGCTTCLHGDLHTGNLIRAEGRDYWIDFDRFSYGAPILDIGHMYNSFVAVSNLGFVQKLFHMNKEQLNTFWDFFVEEYYDFSEEEAEKFNQTIDIYNALDLIQRNYTRPGFFSDLVTLLLIRPKVKKYFQSVEGKQE